MCIRDRFYTAAGILSDHPALKASSPQAPISDFFFDDFHHNGAFLQSYFFTYPVFGVQKKDTTSTAWYSHQMINTGTKDGYQSVSYTHLDVYKRQ